MEDNNMNENGFQGNPEAQQNNGPAFDSGVNYGAPQQNYNPNPNPQPVYTQPVYNPVNNEPVGIGTWIGIIFLMMIPCVNIIMLFVWAFTEGKESRKNFAKAQLIVIGIMIVLYIILILLLGSTISSLINNLSYYSNYWY